MVKDDFGGLLGRFEYNHGSSWQRLFFEILRYYLRYLKNRRFRILLKTSCISLARYRDQFSIILPALKNLGKSRKLILDPEKQGIHIVNL